MRKFKSNEEIREFWRENMGKVETLQERIRIGHTVRAIHEGEEKTLYAIEGDVAEDANFLMNFGGNDEHYIDISCEDLPEILEDESSKRYTEYLKEKPGTSYVVWLEENLAMCEILKDMR